MAALKPACEQRNCKIIGLSVDPVDDHRRWVKGIQEVSGNAVTYPLIGDPDLRVAKLYGMLPATAGETSQGRTPVQNQTVRSVLVIGPDKTVKAIIAYPMTTGRNFEEVVRSEEHTSELQTLMRISYAAFGLNKKKYYDNITT